MQWEKIPSQNIVCRVMKIRAEILKKVEMHSASIGMVLNLKSASPHGSKISHLVPSLYRKFSRQQRVKRVNGNSGKMESICTGCVHTLCYQPLLVNFKRKHAAPTIFSTNAYFCAVS